MTDKEETNNQLVEEPYAVVEAFIDGEPVDAQALKDALAEPAARDHLVDLLVLRNAVGTMAPMAWSAAGRRPRGVWNRTRWLAAAAAVVLSLTAGYVTGQRVGISTPTAPGVETAVDVGSSPIAPTPTQVITLRPGVDWTERSGGK